MSFGVVARRAFVFTAGRWFPADLPRRFGAAKRFERRALFRCEKYRLLPRREVAPLVELAEIYEFGMRPLGPTPRG